MLVPCSHTFCQVCWKDWEQKDKRGGGSASCPHCQKPAEQVLVPTDMQNFVEEMHVHCINFSASEAPGAVRCKNSKHGCTAIDSFLDKQTGLLRVHVGCQFDADRRIVECSSTCEWRGLVKHRERHRATDPSCPVFQMHMLVDCPVPGCTEKVKRYLLDSHIKDPEFSSEHTEKLKAKIESLREDNRLLLVKTRENVAQRRELSKLCST
eukprot:2507185-Rhodomonas_salina.1